MTPGVWTEDQLLDLLEASPGDFVGPNEDWEYVGDQEDGSGRWSSYTLHIIRPRKVDCRDDFFGRIWEAGLTEQQDYRSWHADWEPLTVRMVVEYVRKR